MDIKMIEAFLRLIPLLIEIGKEVTDMVERLRDEGYDVPSIDELKELNERLRRLPDVE